jgi:hypothetical protein
MFVSRLRSSAASMAEIVGGFGVPHNPHVPRWVAENRPPAADVERLYGAMSDRLRTVAPDAIVFFTADHYNIFFESCVPVVGVGVARSAAGGSDCPDRPRRAAAGGRRAWYVRARIPNGSDATG